MHETIWVHFVWPIPLMHFRAFRHNFFPLPPSIYLLRFFFCNGHLCVSSKCCLWAHLITSWKEGMASNVVYKNYFTTLCSSSSCGTSHSSNIKKIVNSCQYFFFLSIRNTVFLNCPQAAKFLFLLFLSKKIDISLQKRTRYIKTI